VVNPAVQLNTTLPPLADPLPQVPEYPDIVVLLAKVLPGLGTLLQLHETVYGSPVFILAGLADSVPVPKWVQQLVPLQESGQQLLPQQAPVQQLYWPDPQQLLQLGGVVAEQLPLHWMVPELVAPQLFADELQLLV
jgi:hypothetical protein